MDLIDKYNNTIINNLKDYSYNQNHKIGNLSEKTLHKSLKDLYGEKINQEIKIGTYYVDVLNDKKIIEIQTKQFNRLREKLKYLISLNEYDINIIYPVFNSKVIYWVNSETGEINGGNKSPKKFKVPEVFYELYKIKSLLNKVNITLLLLDIDEYRNLNGYNKTKKRGSSCNERIPKKLVKIIELKAKEDYKSLFPKELPKEFTSSMLASLTFSSIRYANLMLNVLVSLEVVEVVKKEGRKYIYTIK